MKDDLLELAPGIGPAAFSPEARIAFDDMFQATRERGAAHLESHLASLPRRVGREQPWSGMEGAIMIAPLNTTKKI